VPWDVVLPVKGGSAAKSRLRAPAGLALAMALDCVEAVVGAAPVARAVVVTGDETVATGTSALGAHVVRQPPPGGLRDAVERGLRAARPGPVAVLLADLPCLRPDDLATALDGAARLLASGAPSVLVPDAEGSGTVLLAAAAANDLRHAFGAGSARRHRDLGAVDLDAPPRLRRDVDTRDDLVHAERLGVGPRTARTLHDMQATVLRYDAATRTGEVVTDDGVRLSMTPDALDGSGLRHLRPGQRVSCTASGDDGVSGVHLRGIED
jgi:2-phospho-L-lactate guanylyltransferase